MRRAGAIDDKIVQLSGLNAAIVDADDIIRFAGQIDLVDIISRLSIERNAVYDAIHGGRYGRHIVKMDRVVPTAAIHGCIGGQKRGAQFNIIRTIAGLHRESLARERAKQVHRHAIAAEGARGVDIAASQCDRRRRSDFGRRDGA